MKITTDWHIHSQNSCDGACMTIDTLVKQAAGKGITDFGITDHIHTPFNLPDLAASKKEYLSCNPSPNFHFGVEVSCLSKWEIAEVAKGTHDNPVYGIKSGRQHGCELAIGITEADISEHEIEFVVGGVHWPMFMPENREEVIKDYHRQNMFFATHPLIDIVAHPWWWMGYWKNENNQFTKEPWFDDFKVIPDAMHNEFAAAAIENKKVVEVNLGAMLLTERYLDNFKQQYLEYIADLQEKGVTLSIGSDCHSEEYDTDFEKCGEMMEQAGIKDDFWCLPERTQ